MIGSLRSTEWGLLGLASVLILAIAGIVSGIVHSPDWLPEQATRTHNDRAAKAHVAPSATLQSLALTWQAPLFSTDRTADRSVDKAQASSLAGLTLTGIMIDGELRVAMIKRTDGPPLKVHQGESLPNGWKLEKLTPVQADFSSDGRTQSLALSALRLPPPSKTPPISLSRESTQ